MQWVDQLGEDFLDAVAALERQPGGVPGVGTINFLRGLLTESSRRAILPVMVEKTLAELKMAVDRERRHMWVEWHFEMAPVEVIHPERSVLLWRRLHCMLSRGFNTPPPMLASFRLSCNFVNG